MTGINVNQTDKDRFDAHKPSDLTQAEFFETVMDTYENADEPVTINVEQLTEEIKSTVASNIELAAYRGVTEAIEQAQND
jgi:hypothetical protein